MNESSFNRSINIETEDIEQAHQKAVSLMDKIEQLAITFFSSINEVDLSIDKGQKDTALILVTGENLNAELELEIANNIRYLGGVEEKYLSLNISEHSGAKSLDIVNEISKETKFWFKFIGFVIGGFIAFTSTYKFKSIGLEIRPGPWVIIIIIFGAGLLFGKIGGWVAGLIFKIGKKSIDSDEEYQTNKKYWTDFINGVKWALDNEYGGHNPNEHSAQAGANKDRTIALKEVIVPLLNYEQYEETENFRKICEAFEKYSGNKNPDAFIIFENQSTENILQFCKTKKSEFQLNIPMQCLNSTERIRAERYLRKITETKNGGNLFDETNGFPFEEDGQFYMVLPEDIEIIIKIIFGFFIEVYLLPPHFKLKITEGSF